MKNLIIAFLLAFTVIPNYAQELFFGFETDENGNALSKSDPISVLYLTKDSSFYIFNEWYEEPYWEPLYKYNSKYAFIPEMKTVQISNGIIKVNNNKISLNDASWRYSHILYANKDSSLTYKSGLPFFKNWKYINYKKLFQDCIKGTYLNTVIGQFENSILLDSVLAYHGGDSSLNILKTSLQHSKEQEYFKKKDKFKDSLSKMIIEFEDENYKIIYEANNQLLSVGKAYKSLDYILLDDDTIGVDYIIKFISDSELELIYCNPILSSLEFFVPLEKNKIGWKPWTFSKVEKK